MKAGVPLVPARLTPTSARRSAPWTFAPFRSPLPGRPKDLYALPCSRGAPCSPVNLRTRRLQKIDPSGGPNSRSTRKPTSVPTGKLPPLLMPKTAARTAKTISTPAIPKKVPKAPPSETHTLLRALLKRATTKPMTAPPINEIPSISDNKVSKRSHGAALQFAGFVPCRGRDFGGKQRPRTGQSEQNRHEKTQTGVWENVRSSIALKTRPADPKNPFFLKKT